METITKEVAHARERRVAIRKRLLAKQDVVKNKYRIFEIRNLFKIHRGDGAQGGE